MDKNIYKNLKKDIDNYKKKLIKKAKENGIYENFWQEYVSKLEDKYSNYRYTTEFKEIFYFSEWCSTYNG